jgi:hypothetical protein
VQKDVQALLNNHQARDKELQELKLLSLRQQIQIGIDQLESGQFTDYTETELDDLFDEIQRDGRPELGLLECSKHSVFEAEDGN